MRNLVNLTGDFSIDELKKVISQVEVLANQPPLKIHKIYTDKNPQLNYREIFVSKTTVDSKEYHVMDMGRVRDVPEVTSIGDRIYSEEEVEKLK